jgi:hypothetical protein
MGDYDMYLILTVTKFKNIFNFSGLLWREGHGSEVPVVFYRQTKKSFNLQYAFKIVYMLAYCGSKIQTRTKIRLFHWK